MKGIDKKKLKGLTKEEKIIAIREQMKINKNKKTIKKHNKKIKEDKNKKESVKTDTEVKLKKHINSMKFNNEIKDALNSCTGFLVSVAQEKLNDMFKKELKGLRKSGQFYKPEYKVFKNVSEVAKEGIKKIEKDNWVYAFGMEEKIVFMRQRMDRKNEKK